MNKEILNQFPTDEQPVAAKLDSLVEDMRLSPTFQWELENQLMDKAKKQMQPGQGRRNNLFAPVGWAIAALVAVFLLNLTIRSLVPGLQQPAAEQSPTPELSFADSVRKAQVCAGPLALAHNFSVFLTNEDKTGFVRLDEQGALEEARSFAWSPDGTQLAAIGNTAGQSQIYLKDFASELQYVVSGAEVGYVRDASWSRDGEQLLLWSSQNNLVMYVMDADGSNLIEQQLEAQIFGTPQFTPDKKSIIFYGADSTADGLFEAPLDGSQTRLISDLVEAESGFAWSADGMRLAYIEMDRRLGEARLVVQEIQSGNKTVLTTLPIPKGSGSSIPNSANLSWSADGRSLVFDFGRSASDRAIYLVPADGTEAVKVADSAYAPTISADGRCLAYISNRQIFVLDVAGTSSSSTTTPIALADLPPGKGNAGFELDKLQWRP